MQELICVARILFTPMKARTIIFAAAMLLSRVDAGDWPRFRGPEGDGSWNPPGLPEDPSRIRPRRLWSAKIGAGFSGVTVSGGRVYVMDRESKPEEVERVLCFNAGTGRELWRHVYPAVYGKLDYGTGPRASVTLHEGRAYTLGAVGMALCLDAETGKVIWRRDTVKELGARISTWGFAASPFIRRDTVLLHLGARPDGSVVALDRSTGAERWRAGADAAGYCTPVVVSHRGAEQLIQWGPEHIAGFDPDGGGERWRIPYKITYGVSIAQPIFHEGLLFVSGYWHGARAIRLGDTPGDAALAWSEEKTLCGLMSQPLYREGVVFLLTKAEGVVAFRLRDGKILWTDKHQLTPADRNPQMSMVWADQKNGIACCLNAVGELLFVRLGAERFEELSRHQVIGKTWAHPAFTGNAVHARSDSEIVAWKLWE